MWRCSVRRRKRKDVVGAIRLTVEAGRFTCVASAPLMGDFKVHGDNLEDLRYDIDYHDVRKDLAHSLRQMARVVERNPEFISMMEEE